MNPLNSRFLPTLLFPLLMAIAVAESPKIPAEGVPPATQADSVASAAVLDRITIIGASVSAGFQPMKTAAAEGEMNYAFKNFVAGSLKEEPKSLTSYADLLLFTNVDAAAKEQIAKAVADKPTLTLAVDFLFWHCYGANLPMEQDRLNLFEKGLVLLEKLPSSSTIVVGNVPNATAAAGGILLAAQVPKPETIRKANKRLAEWAKAHPNVVLLDLEKFMDTCLADAELKIGHLTWVAGKTKALLQPDKLHPGRHGCTALALAIMQALADQKLVPADKVIWEKQRAYEKALEKCKTP